MDESDFDDFDLNPEDFPVDDSMVYESVVQGTKPSEQGLGRVRLSRDDIQNRSVSTAAEAVEYEPSVYGQTTPKGERELRLRGFDQRGVGVYLDGVPFVMPWSGSMDLGKLPAEMIDSILLLKGPVSIVYGPGGMGGAVLIETRDPSEGPMAEAEVEVGGLARGSLADERMTFYHGRKQGRLGYAIGLGHVGRDDYHLSSVYTPRETMEGQALRNANGTLDNSDRSMQHAAGKIHLDLPGDNTLKGQVLFVDGRFGIPRSETDDRPFFQRFTSWRGLLAQVGHVYDSKNFTLEDAVYAAFYDNRMDGYDDATYTTQDYANASRSWYRDRTFGGRVRGTYTLRKLSQGDICFRLWLSFQHDIHGSQYVFGGQDTDNHEFVRTLVTAVPEIEFPIVSKLRGTVGVQTDIEIPEVSADELVLLESKETAPETVVAPQPMLSLRYDPKEALMVRLVGAKRSRIPSLSERFSGRKGFTKANPGLEKESAWYFSLEVDWQINDRIEIGVTGFDAEVSNLIHSEYLPETNGIKQKQNVGRARLAGCEGLLSIKPIPKLSFTAAYAYLFARRLDETEDEDRIAQIPSHQATLGVSSAPLEWMKVASFFRIVGSQAFDDYTILGLGELGAYVTWDARIDFEPISFLTVFIKATNILDMNYQTRYGYPDRGASMWLGLRLTV